MHECVINRTINILPINVCKERENSVGDRPCYVDRADSIWPSSINQGVHVRGVVVVMVRMEVAWTQNSCLLASEDETKAIFLGVKRTIKSLLMDLLI